LQTMARIVTPIQSVVPRAAKCGLCRMRRAVRGLSRL
jgi:hypothetical protein